MRISGLLCFGALAGVALASTETGIAKRSTVSEILTDIEDAATCAACEVCRSTAQFDNSP